MKLTIITSAILTSSLIFSNIVLANDDIQVEKQWSVGVGSYALVLEHDELGDDDFSGGALSVTYVFSNKLSINGQIYALEHDDVSAVEVSGFDMSVLYGTGLASEGFKAYIGVGLYNETFEFESFEEDFSGVQISGGFGYNWDSVSLDLSLGIRSVGDYEDLADDGEDIIVVSSSLVLAYRF